jgi:ADP-heptose:LPS heptosyltransferase
MPEGSPSVLIIRLDAIGDALALTPLLAALRRHAIQSDIVLRQANAGVFASRAARQVITAGFELRSNTRANRTAIDELGTALRENGYTHVLVATEDPGGYRLARSVASPLRIGFADPIGKPFKALWSRALLTKTIYRSAGLDRRAPHECDVLFSLGASLLTDEKPTRDVAQLRPLVLEREPEPDDRIAVQITQKWKRLGIELSDVVEMIRRLTAYGELQLIGDRREAVYADHIAQRAGLNVTLFDDLEPWKAAIAAAPAVVTPDSGALHVAGMVGTPVVGIFPPEPTYRLRIARWSPWAAPHRIIRADRGWPARTGEALAELLPP